MTDIKNSTEVMAFKETILWRGKPMTLDAVRVNGQTFLVRGKLVKRAEIWDEWQQSVDDPETIIRQLRNSGLKVDIFKFWQRIPDTDVKYPFYHEWQDVAAIPISTHKHWFEKQIDQKARNKVRKASKRGVVVQGEELNDRMIRGIMEIYNQSPVRRGKPFWHYGKDFDTVKKELSGELDRSLFVTAYFENELIGFIKFMITDRYAMTTLILDKTAHRDKAPMNAMVSKVVEICAEKGIPYFAYTIWRRGAHGQFQESNGFTRIRVPEYFVPLNAIGRLALRLNLHRGIKGAIPEKWMIPLLELRAKIWALRFRTKAFSFE